jgi:hypothetical protein
VSYRLDLSKLLLLQHAQFSFMIMFLKACTRTAVLYTQIFCPPFEIRGYFTTDGQSVSMSWYRTPLWDLRPDITSCWNAAV